MILLSPQLLARSRTHSPFVSILCALEQQTICNLGFVHIHLALFSNTFGSSSHRYQCRVHSNGEHNVWMWITAIYSIIGASVGQVRVPISIFSLTSLRYSLHTPHSVTVVCVLCVCCVHCSNGCINNIVSDFKFLHFCNIINFVVDAKIHGGIGASTPNTKTITTTTTKCGLCRLTGTQQLPPNKTAQKFPYVRAEHKFLSILSCVLRRRRWRQATCHAYLYVHEF